MQATVSGTGEEQFFASSAFFVVDGEEVAVLRFAERWMDMSADHIGDADWCADASHSLSPYWISHFVYIRIAVSKK